MDAPFAIGQLFQPLHLGLGEDGGAGIARHRQIVHVDRVLGVHVAAGDAVAAIDARLLWDALRVRPIDGEVDRDVQRLHLIAELLRAHSQRFYLA